MPKYRSERRIMPLNSHACDYFAILSCIKQSKNSPSPRAFWRVRAQSCNCYSAIGALSVSKWNSNHCVASRSMHHPATNAFIPPEIFLLQSPPGNASSSFSLWGQSIRVLGSPVALDAEKPRMKENHTYFPQANWTVHDALCKARQKVQTWLARLRLDMNENYN